MGRPRGFNEAEILDLLVEQFWSQGFDGVSLRDVESKTGLKLPSLYNAFGDKRSLFRAALERYVDTHVRARIKRHETGRGSARVRGFIEEGIESSLANPDRMGCLLVNSAVDVAPHDPDLRGYVAACFADLEAFFLEAIRDAVGEGNPLCPSPERTARACLALLFGLRVMARARMGREALDDAARPLLDMLDAATALRTHSR